MLILDLIEADRALALASELKTSLVGSDGVGAVAGDVTEGKLLRLTIDEERVLAGDGASSAISVETLLSSPSSGRLASSSATYLMMVRGDGVSK